MNDNRKQDGADNGVGSTGGSAYYALFAHMSESHGLTLLDSEMEDICRVVEKMRQTGYRQCRICGFSVDVSKGASAPEIEFPMQGRKSAPWPPIGFIEVKRCKHGTPEGYLCRDCESSPNTQDQTASPRH